LKRRLVKVMRKTESGKNEEAANTLRQLITDLDRSESSGPAAPPPSQAQAATTAHIRIMAEALWEKIYANNA